MVFPLYSITKTMIAALIMAEKIDRNRPVSDWLDETWVARGRDITLHQLLTHTSGLRDYFMVRAYGDAVEKGSPVWNDLRFAEETLTHPLLFEPGEGWSYSNPGFWVLKRVLELETGESFKHLVQTRIAEPLKLPSLTVAEGLFSPNLPDYPAEWVWHGLACANANDTARFMASTLTENLGSELVSVPNAGPTYPDAAYGLGVMADMKGEAFGHNGSGPGFSTSCYRFPRSNMTIAYLMSHDGPDDAAYVKMRNLAAEVGATPYHH
jgi:D-alanyl-D-alanine carboxypeptidase